MRFLLFLIISFSSCLFIVPAYAGGDDCGDNQTETQFMRDDLVSLKKVMMGIVGAIGKAPTPYAKEDEDWTLPTYTCKDKNGYFPISVSYSEDLTTDAVQKKFNEDAQKKLMEAQARGDFQAMGKLTQQIQAQAMQQAMANQNMTPITINVYANDDSSQTIDPDSVLKDGTGFIAMKSASNGESSDQEQIEFYFDPVELKDAKKLASFDLGGNLRVPDKLALNSIRIEMTGPAVAVEAIAKELKTGEVLKRLSNKRTKIGD